MLSEGVNKIESFFVRVWNGKQFYKKQKRKKKTRKECIYVVLYKVLIAETGQ